MAFHTAADVPMLVASPSASSERRISPSWTIAQLKKRLEPVTGIPPSSQQLSLRLPSQHPLPLVAADEEQMRLAAFPLQPYAEISVVDTRPPAARIDFNDLSRLDKYEMPTAEYESRADSVLAWKKTQKLGRFDPQAGSREEQKIRASEREVEERGLSLSCRVRLLPESDARRATVRFLGPVPEIPGVGAWVGLALDEPTGKHDGAVSSGKRYFTCAHRHGLFVRPDRCQVGSFPPLDMTDTDEEEL